MPCFACKEQSMRQIASSTKGALAPQSLSWEIICPPLKSWMEPTALRGEAHLHFDYKCLEFYFGGYIIVWQ